MKNKTNQEEKKQFYDREIEETMRRFHSSLNEKDGRRYAGVEALKIGHGGRSYIAKVMGCSRRTVSKGACEVSSLSKKEVDQRIRKKGGGRKSYQNKYSEIDEKFLLVLRHHTANRSEPGRSFQGLEERHHIFPARAVPAASALRTAGRR